MEDPPVCSINCLLIVADTYGSLHVVMPKIQLYIKHLKMSGVAPLLAECPRDLLDLAINLRRRWLFKEVVCRLMADPTRDDEEICRIFEGHESLTLVLEKRKELRSTMKQVDDNLLTLLPTPPLFSRSNSLAKALGVAKFREDMAKRMKMWWYEKQWKDYPSKYREILEISKERPPPIFDGFINDIDGISGTSNITTDATAVYQRCYEVAARTITPLLHTFVREYPGKKPVKPRKQDMNEGFTCIGVFDEDLPWEYKTLWEVL